MTDLEWMAINNDLNRALEELAKALYRASLAREPLLISDIQEARDMVLRVQKKKGRA